METERECIKCKHVKPIDQFYRHKPSREGRLTRCKSCKHPGESNHRLRMFLSSKINAYNRGLEHTITEDDIPLPVICRYLGIRLVYRAKIGKRIWNGPSIDRIDSTKGYVPGNIQVISDLANRMKQNATIPQLVMFAKGVIRHHGGAT